MARYKDAVCRLCRAEGMKLFLKGTRCDSPKCAIEKREYRPGVHGNQRGGRRRRPTEYALQLREKQKIRRVYGVLETPFRTVFAHAERMKGITGENLLRRLELRLDSVAYRSGFADSRAAARQMVCHGHVLLNGRRCDIASALLSVGDKLSLSKKAATNLFTKDSLKRAEEKGAPAWLTVSFDKAESEIVSPPSKEEIGIPVQEQLVVELYSK